MTDLLNGTLQSLYLPSPFINLKDLLYPWGYESQTHTGLQQLRLRQPAKRRDSSPRLSICKLIDTYSTGSHSQQKKEANKLHQVQQRITMGVRAGTLALCGWGSCAPSAWMEKREEKRILRFSLQILWLWGKLRQILLGGAPWAATRVVAKKITIRY